MSRIMMPILVRVRRRRLMLLVALLLIFILYLRSFSQYETNHAQESKFVAASSPEDSLAALSAPQDESVLGPDTASHPAATEAASKDMTSTPPAGAPDGAGGAAGVGENHAPEDSNAPPRPDEENKDENAPQNIEASEVPPDTKTVVVGGRTFLDPGAQPMVPMEYGTTARPPVQGLTKVVEELPVELVVSDVNDMESTASAASLEGKPLRRRRFVFVGDVHGQRRSLDELLEKINFEPGLDHLVLVGDLVNKGPDSAGVVQRAMDLGASAVRGNHEDRVLAAYDSIHKKQMAPSSESIIDHDDIDHDIDHDIDPLEQNPFPHGDMPERKTAASLSPEQAAWLSDLPVILHLGKIAPSSPSAVAASVQEEEEENANLLFNDVVVAHAGLVPGIPLERQDPYAVMVMRSLVHPADEVRQERARLVAELKIRAESRGRIHPNRHVNVPQHRADAEFQKMQKIVYGPDPHHPRRPSPPGSPKRIAGGFNPSAADLVMLPIEGHFHGGRDRVHWAAAWNQAQHEKPSPENRTTVIYGHDALTGLLVPEAVPSRFMSLFGAGGNGGRSGSVVTATDTGYTFGLDSGAVYGGKLTALIVEADRTGRVRYSIEQVQCPAAAKKNVAD